jgi:hypothetical protein
MENRLALRCQAWLRAMQVAFIKLLYSNRLLSLSKASDKIPEVSLMLELWQTLNLIYSRRHKHIDPKCSKASIIPLVEASLRASASKSNRLGGYGGL